MQNEINPGDLVTFEGFTYFVVLTMPGRVFLRLWVKGRKVQTGKSKIVPVAHCRKI